MPLFIFDRNILDLLEDKKDRRVEYIHNTVKALNSEFAAMGVGFEVHYDFPVNVFTGLLENTRCVLFIQITIMNLMQ